MSSYSLSESPLPSRAQRARVFDSNILIMLGTE